MKLSKLLDECRYIRDKIYDSSEKVIENNYQRLLIKNYTSEEFYLITKKNRNIQYYSKISDKISGNVYEFLFIIDSDDHFHDLL